MLPSRVGPSICAVDAKPDAVLIARLVPGARSGETRKNDVFVEFWRAFHGLPVEKCGPSERWFKGPFRIKPAQRERFFPKDLLPFKVLRGPFGGAWTDPVRNQKHPTLGHGLEERVRR